MALCKLWTAEVASEPPLLTLAMDHSLRVFGHDHLKPVQSEAVQALLQGEDVFITVPTGYGKSLIYQMLPACAAFILERLRKAAASVPLVLVVSPLLALMEDQANKLRRLPGAKPLLLSEESAPEDIAGSGWTHIFASPEALLESPRWRSLLLDSSLMNSIVAVVVDEAHCIVKWLVQSHMIIANCTLAICSYYACHFSIVWYTTCSTKDCFADTIHIHACAYHYNLCVCIMAVHFKK